MDYTSRPIKLKKDTLNNLLSKFQPDTQSRKIIDYLAQNKRVPASILREIANADNVGQVVRCAINPRLLQFGYQIACEKVPCQQLFLWSLYKLEGVRHAG